MATSALLRDGTILSDRYYIVKQIGKGGFGRTYLAEDTHRYRELCVLKEFAPQVESRRELRKAEELFEREAGILYRLKHEQIPDFQALLKTRVNGKECLFLVQEYVEGDTYWDLLKREGKLRETEVSKMIWELLPVLEYIHSQGLIHRDISPDNLILRVEDDRPVLIDFGCVKLAANAVSKSTGQSLTLIGKKGYSPEEQLRHGEAYANSDLYALAATAVVLLTGKLPDDLYDRYQHKWNWQSEAEVSPALEKILTKMLAYRPRDRFSSAAKVRQALETESSSLISSVISRIRTLVVAPADNEATDLHFTRPVSRAISHVTTRAVSFSRQISRIPTRIPTLTNRRQLKSWHWGLIITGVMLLPGMLSFSLIKEQLLSNAASDSTSSLSRQEKNKQKQIYRRVKALDLNSSAFYRQVDTVFHEQYPRLQGTQLSDSAEHQPYRQIWYEIAGNLLDRYEQER